MLFLVKLNPEFSSSLLVEAKATDALSLLLLAAKKKAVKACYRIVSAGQLRFDCRSYCGRSRRIQGARRPLKSEIPEIFKLETAIFLVSSEKQAHFEAVPETKMVFFFFKAGL